MIWGYPQETQIYAWLLLHIIAHIKKLIEYLRSILELIANCGVYTTQNNSVGHVLLCSGDLK